MGCSHAAGCPLFPYLRRACKAGASTTATAQINGSAVPATRCHSPASACRSACCPTEPARDTSKRRPRRADPAPPARRPPLDSPRRHDPLRGHRSPRPGPSRHRPSHMSSHSRGLEPRHRKPWPSSKPHLHQQMSGMTGRHRPHRSADLQTASLDNHGTRPPRSAAGGLVLPIG